MRLTHSSTSTVCVFIKTSVLFAGIDNYPDVLHWAESVLV